MAIGATKAGATLLGCKPIPRTFNKDQENRSCQNFQCVEESCHKERHEVVARPGKEMKNISLRTRETIAQFCTMAETIARICGGERLIEELGGPWLEL